MRRRPEVLVGKLKYAEELEPSIVSEFFFASSVFAQTKFFFQTGMIIFHASVSNLVHSIVSCDLFQLTTLSNFSCVAR